MKINLLKADTIYMIRRKDLNDPHFFLYDAVTDPTIHDIDAVLWTPVQYKAREFYTEESVEDFFYYRLKNRPCEIIMVK